MNTREKIINILSSKEKYYDFFNTSHSMWIPTSDDKTKTIKLNFIIVQKTINDPNNFLLNGFRSDGISDTTFLRNMILSINNIYANLADPSDNGGQLICGSCNQVKNSKIQFSLEAIHTVVDGTTWSSTYTPSYSFNPSNEINVYITPEALNYSWCKYYSKNLSLNIHIVMNNVYQKYILFDEYTPTHLLAHELGHALGLCHTYLGGGCDNSKEDMLNNGNFFDDHFGTYPGRCPEPIGTWNFNPYLSNSDGITNNIMSSTIHRNYWTPKQIGAMHRNLAFNNIRKYLKNSTRNPIPIVVNTDEVWDFDMLLDRDIKLTT